MDHIWTPWRYHYIASAGKASECVLCYLLDQNEDEDPQNYILVRRQHSYVVLNRYPYTAGHLMIVSRRHVPSLADSSAEELHEIILTSRECEKIVQSVYRPEGFNIGFNVGKSAGAGVAGHLHLHVVPRWQGDANFVSVVGQTRVIPEDLETTYRKLAEHF